MTWIHANSRTECKVFVSTKSKSDTGELWRCTEHGQPLHYLGPPMSKDKKVSYTSRDAERIDKDDKRINAENRSDRAADEKLWRLLRDEK